MKLMSFLLVTLAVVGWSKASPVTPREQTLAGLNEAAGNDLRAAEAEMATLLDGLMRQAAGKADATRLAAAQAAWKAYRDASGRSEVAICREGTIRQRAPNVRRERVDASYEGACSGAPEDA